MCLDGEYKEVDCSVYGNTTCQVINSETSSKAKCVINENAPSCTESSCKGSKISLCQNGKEITMDCNELLRECKKT